MKRKRGKIKLGELEVYSMYILEGVSTFFLLIIIKMVS